MIFYDLSYEFAIISIVNILRVGLLKKVTDSFLTAGRLSRKLLGAAFVLYYAGTTVMYGCFRASMAYALCNAVGVIGIACFYRAPWLKKIWISLSFLCMDTGCLLTVYYAVSRKISGPAHALWVLLLFLCVLTIGSINESEEEKEASFDARQMLLLLFIPALSLCAFGRMAYGNIDTAVAAFLCCALTVLNLCVFYLYHALQKNYVQLREQDIYKQQTFAYQNQLDVIMQSQSRIRALKHDMKNHLLTLQALAKDSRSEALTDYLSSMQEFMTNPSEHIITGNEALDSLLNYKVQKANELLKHVETKLQTTEQLLTFHMRMEKGILFLHMINSCDGISDGMCDIRRLAEKSAEGHGIGLFNIKRIVEKYNGEMEMNCRENQMETSIILYMQQL